MMREANVPLQNRQNYREYLREAKVHDQRSQFHEVAQRFSPLLRGHLMLHISQRLIQQAYYFKNAPELVIMDVADGLSSRFYTRSEPLFAIRYCLCFVERGTVAHGGKVHVPGSVFQEDFILTNRALQRVKDTLSLTYTQLLVLGRPYFD